MKAMFTVITPSKAAEAAALDAAVAAWGRGGQIVRVAPMEGEDFQCFWKALPEPSRLLSSLRLEAEAEAEAEVAAFHQWKRKLPW